MKNSMRPRDVPQKPTVTTDTFVRPVDGLDAKLTVRLTSDLHRSIKMLALQRGVSVQDLVNELLSREVHGPDLSS